MAYQWKAGFSASQLTISTWVKVDQSALDDAVANGDSSWGVAIGKIPMLTLGRTKDQGSANQTQHVQDEFPVSIGSRLISDGVGQPYAVGSLTGVPPGPGSQGASITGAPYYVTGGAYDVNSHQITGLVPFPSGISGTTDVVDSFTNETLASVTWDFSGILSNGHSPNGLNWKSNSYSGTLTYSYDITLDQATIAIAPSSLFLRSGQVAFLAAENAVQRISPSQNFWEFDDSASAFVTDTSWNHVYFTLDLSDQSAVNWAMVVNFADKTVYSDNLSGLSSPGIPAIGGEQFGISITPQESDLHFSVGLNANIRYAYTQIWFDRFIEPTPTNLANFATIKGSTLVPPTDIFAAQKTFGGSDIYAYRDKNANVSYQTGFTVVGSAPADYTPGPGQSATGLTLQDLPARWQLPGRDISRAVR